MSSYVDLVNSRSGGGDRGGERGWGPGWTRGRGGNDYERPMMNRRGPLGVNVRPSAFKVAKSFSRTRDVIWKNDLLGDSMAAAGYGRNEEGTKLYISNLDYGVSNEDIKELFSEIGELKHSSVHYDRNGRPSGSAEVVFLRRSDAVAALKRYNNVQLDGKAMKIEIIGDKLNIPVSARINVSGRGGGRERRTVIMSAKPGFPGSTTFNRFPRDNFQGRRGAFQGTRGRGRGIVAGGGRGRGRGPAGVGRGRGRGRGRQQGGRKSAEELDKDLENYHAEAMNTS